MDDIEQKKANRFLYLRKIYKETDTNTSVIINSLVVGEELFNYDKYETNKIVKYLVDKGLLENHGIGRVRITHEGIEEIEEAISNINSPTKYFSDGNIINNIINGDISNSLIQQNTTESAQIVNSDVDVNEINKILKECEKINDCLILDELKSDIETLKSQINSPKPKKNIITESLKSIKNIIKQQTVPVLFEMIKTYLLL